MSVEVQVHTVPHFKGLIELDSTFILCYSILKTAILLHKRGLVKTEVLSTVDYLTSVECRNALLGVSNLNLIF